ncbi:MAG: GTPase ObgE [Leptospirales bacterium]|nr:GTPase ObgE [Leptospirales bacterium]
MKFVDEIEVRIRAGHGGPGCVSFLREKYRPHGGPDGGDGGRGGDFYLRADPSLQSLGHLRQARLYRAADGEAGSGLQCSGPAGQDAELRLPVGSAVYDAESGELLADLDRSEMRVLAARGGKGGLGNQHFASSVNQAPAYAQSGLPGEERRLLLKLKLLADVGLVGLPNAGKSTLLAAVSRSHPKIADYAFTTLIPNIGVVEGANFRRLLLADIPGIIEGASRGHGLGLSFLRHIERVRVIVYLIDIASLDHAAEIELLKNELRQYSAELLHRPALVVLNKCDLASYDPAFLAEIKTRVCRAELWSDAVQAVQAIAISALERRGVEALIEALFELLPESTLAEQALPGSSAQQDAPRQLTPAEAPALPLPHNSLLGEAEGE